jgi:fructose-bisphosphate aldolase class II
VLHGTHGVTDELFLETIPRGIHKINLNKTVRDVYTEFVAKNAGTMELTVLKEKSVSIYTDSIVRVMGVIGSLGRA